MAPFNNITSPFDKPWDLSLKADQERWLVASTASSDHVRFDVLVATATPFLELLQDKSEYYRWGPLMSVPIDGDGAFDKNSTSLSGGETVMKVNFLTRVDLLTHWTKVSTDHCQCFVQWFNRADDMKLDAPFGEAVDQKVVRLDCSPTDNIGLVRRFKVQLRIIDQLILHVLKNHTPPLLTSPSWPTKMISRSRTRRPVTSFTAVSSCSGRCLKYPSPRPLSRSVISRSS